MRRSQIIQSLKVKYPFHLAVSRNLAPKPHEVEVPYDFAYTPTAGAGAMYLFLTDSDRQHFASKYRLELRSS